MVTMLGETDWTSASIPELIAHLVRVHHAHARDTLRRAEVLVRQASVFPATAEAKEMARRYRAFAQDFLSHLDHEESELFPLCLSLERALHHPDEAEKIDVGVAIHAMSLGHGDAAEALAVMLGLARSLPHGNKPRIVAELRAMFEDLAVDLVEHSRLEEEILLPAVIFAQEIVAARKAHSMPPLGGG
jgi:iron-sulfur cluster repair protein YtfE (RIC family)